MVSPCGGVHQLSILTFNVTGVVKAICRMTDGKIFDAANKPANANANAAQAMAVPSCLSRLADV